MTDDYLVRLLVQIAGQGDHSLKALAIHHEMRDALQAEVLRRLTMKG